MKRLALTLGLAMLAPHSLAQSLNIDFDSAGGGAGSGAPPSSFGGAADQPGVWNAIRVMNQTHALVNRQGWPSGVTLDMQGPSTVTWVNDQRTSGDMEDLLEDGFEVPTEDDTIYFNFQNLTPGPYAVYTYCRHPDSSQRETLITVGLFNQREIGGSMYYANQFAEGITHDRRVVTVSPSGLLHVEIRTNPGPGYTNGFIAGFQLQQLPTRLYVRAGAPAGGDGRSWSTAFNDLRAALSQSEGWFDAVQEIWVAQGTYYTSTAVPSDRNTSFDLVPKVAVYGGFMGVETSREQRDPVAHPSILSGNIGGPLPYDNAACVVRFGIQGVSADEGDAVLDGFTVMGGYGGGGAEGHGAGFYNFKGSPIVRNCRFVSSAATNGGAVYVSEGSPTFVDCEFRNNTASEGGGAYSNVASNGTDTPAADATFVNCRFYDNRGTLLAGAVALGRHSTRFVNCVFTGNDAGAKGGAIYASNSGTSLWLYNCSIVGNTSQINGAGVASELGATLGMHNSIVWDNHGAANSEGTMSSQLALGGAAGVTVTYSTIQFHLPILLSGAGNNGLNPMFVNATGGDGYGQPNDNLRLAPGSPMIDSGDNGRLPHDMCDLDGDTFTWQELTPLDLDRLMRRRDDPGTFDTGSGGAPVVDRGSYEFQAPVASCVADVDDGGMTGNPDGGVTIDDLLYYLYVFETGLLAADVDDGSGTGTPDGGVTIDDLLYFLQRFEAGC